ncbi:MAG: POTRA domain-containing protein [Sterolibacterium sp.]|nr:POTRA domain-containing protein [Sterolibacterium sp.]
MKKTIRSFALASLLAAFGASFSSSFAAEDERIDIARFRIEGNTLLPAEQLATLVGPYAGAGRVYGDIQRALEATENAYRDMGFNNVHVFVPEQELSQGVVKLLVVEGTIGKVAVAEEIPQKTAANTGNPETPMPQASVMMTNEAMEALLREADRLIKSGNYADAYKLLEPKEGDYSGEVAFDYMLGIVALDNGKPDRATIAFERVLITNPNFSGARLDLARAYFAMGSDDLAKNEFEIVLTQSPPGNVKEVVQKYLKAIDERRLAKIQHLSGYIETSIAADNNVTAVTSDFTTGVQNVFGIPGVLPTGSSVLSSGTTAGVSAGVDFTRLVSEEKGLSVFAGADLRQRIYNGISALNSTNLDLRGGLSIASGDNMYRLFVNMGQYRQTGMTAGINANRDTPGLGAEWKRKFGERDQFALTTQYSRPRYATQDTQDTDQILLSASWLHIFEGKTAPLIFASVNQSVDRALRPLATGSDMSRTTTGVRAHFQLTPLANTDVFLSGGVSLREDDSLNARSALSPPVYGRDVTKDVSVGVNWRPWSKWTVKGQVAAYRNNSNLELYQFRRTESTVSVRHDF